jgi:hypothetical protein
MMVQASKGGANDPQMELEEAPAGVLAFAQRLTRLVSSQASWETQIPGPALETCEQVFWVTHEHGF